jgi:CubicO group peptidase (beta-lactamase class C family)
MEKFNMVGIFHSKKEGTMKNRILSVLSLITVFAVFLFSSACPNPQNQYAIDTLPGCNDCTTTLDEDILAELVSKIEDGDYGNIHSLIIIHNDSLALEEYFMEWNRDMLHYCYSVTKSFTSALIGIALEEGYINGLAENLLNFFPEYDDIENLDERKESITLENVLTMTAGFTWDETSTPYVDSEGNPNPENDAIKMNQSSDWIKYMLDLPMSDDPGTKWTYSTGCSILLSGVIANETGQTAEVFAKENLFSKIGITNWGWTTGPNGIINTGAGLQLYPVDMAMFGYLYLKNGLLNGEQIVPENWVIESTRTHVASYAYHWYKFLDSFADDYPETVGTFTAVGYAGQFIMVIPNINMVIVSTADNPGQAPAIFSMLFGYILPALKEK